MARPLRTAQSLCSIASLNTRVLYPSAPWNSCLLAVNVLVLLAATSLLGHSVFQAIAGRFGAECACEFSDTVLHFQLHISLSLSLYTIKWDSDSSYTAARHCVYSYVLYIDVRKSLPRQTGRS
jgi:hypothetical protein